ncbi:ventrally expressed dharma/bozozok antagonist [Festucalex cinctus]
MRGHFSIEWMAQSSRQTPAGLAGLAGTHAESLPGFYRRDDGDIGDIGRPPAPANRPKMDADHQCNKMASEAEEETSGYESERSLSPPAAAAVAAASSSARRPRTAFTAEQIGSLERAFKRNAYLGTQDKAHLCRKLNLSDKQIRNWFQNRRMKLKRTVQDALGAASHFAPYPPEPPAYRPAAAWSAGLPPNLQYASPLDSLYQYGGVAVATPPPPLMGAYAAYPQYY